MRLEGIQLIKEGIDLTYLVKVIPSVDSSSWDKWDFRQDKFDVHKYTKTIPVIWNKETMDILPELNKAVYPYIDLIKQEQGGECVNALIISLPAGRSIGRHVDISELLHAVNRYHYPVITSDKVSFTVNYWDNKLEAGKLYLLNNQLPHSVTNSSDEQRVHLLIDMIKPIGKE